MVNTLVKTAFNSMANNHVNTDIYDMIFSSIIFDRITLDFILKKAMVEERLDIIHGISLNYDLSKLLSIVNKGVLIESINDSLMRKFIIDRIDTKSKFFVCKEKELDEIFKDRNISIKSSLNMRCIKQHFVVYDNIMLFHDEIDSYRYIPDTISKLIEKHMFDIDLMKQQSQGTFDLYEYLIKIDKFKMNSSYIAKSYKLIKMLDFSKYTVYQMLDLMSIKTRSEEQEICTIYRFSQIIECYFKHLKYVNVYKMFIYMLSSENITIYTCHLWLINFVTWDVITQSYLLSNQKLHNMLKLRDIYNLIIEDPYISKYNILVMYMNARV